MTDKINIKAMVASGATVQFTHYAKGELWYQTQCGFAFPVPIEDTQDGVFGCTDKAILFMRYIRRHAQMIDLARETEGRPIPDENAA